MTACTRFERDMAMPIGEFDLYPSKIAFLVRAESNSRGGAALGAGEPDFDTPAMPANPPHRGPGEGIAANVPAGQPVVALLPPANIKARFFVPETEVATLHPGDTVQLACDGCGAPIAASVTRVATEAEYTPPVIYSNAQRAKLVFMAEARPAPADAVRLKPGLPLDVRRAGAGNSKQK